jgi:hypothetical protein
MSRRSTPSARVFVPASVVSPINASPGARHTESIAALCRFIETAEQVPTLAENWRRVRVSAPITCTVCSRQ